MYRTLLKSKIHRATVTDANLNYEGSLSIDPSLMRQADIVPYEQVDVVNINNGQRFSTYAIEGREGSGEICLNGAAARLGSIGDLIIIITYISLSPEEVKHHRPVAILVDEHNNVKSIQK
jgi:aspartate 1-decarboxylase